jgi:hypothetical protein
VLRAAIGALLLALLVAGSLSSSIDVFAWVIAGFGALAASLVGAQIPRWQSDRHFQGAALLQTLILALCAESAAATALFVVGAVVRSSTALVATAIGLLLFIAVCDVTVALRIRRSGWTDERHGETSHDQRAVPQSQASRTRAKNSEREVPALPKRPLMTAFAVLWTILVGIGLALSRRIAPIAIIGVMGVGIAAYTGRLSRKVSGSQPSTVNGGIASGVHSPYASTQHPAQTTSKAATPHVVGQHRWNGPCGSPPSSKVSPDAVTRMVKLFNVESHLEPSAEGCIGVMIFHFYPGDNYVTTTGSETSTGETLSFAVYSEKHGGLMVLNDARAKLEALLEQVGPVGGVGRYPRYLVGSGDYYLLRTALGMYVFIRERADRAYEQLRPGLAKAWYLLMVTLETWLWPSHPLPGLHGKLIYKLWSPRNTERAEAEITFDPKTGIASCGQTLYRPNPSFELSLTKLVELAESS